MNVVRESLGFTSPPNGFFFGDLTITYEVTRRRRVNGQIVIQTTNKTVDLYDEGTSNRGNPIPEAFKHEIDGNNQVVINRKNITHCVATEDWGELFSLLYAFVQTHSYIIPIFLILFVGSYKAALEYVQVNDTVMIAYLGGHASITTKAFLRRIEQEGVRVCPFVDMDLGGLEILKNLVVGSTRLCERERQLVCVDPLWIGVFPSQYDTVQNPNLGITRSMAMGVDDSTGIQAILNNPNHPLFHLPGPPARAQRIRTEIQAILTGGPSGNGWLANTAFMPKNVLRTNIQALIQSGI